MSKYKIKDISFINQNNFDFKNVNYINYLDTGSITENQIEGFQKLVIGKNKIPSRAKRAVKNGTIVYSSVRPKLCHYGIMEDVPENCVVSTGFITIDANLQIVDPYYLYLLLITPAKTEYLAQVADTAVSSYPSIIPEDIGNLEVDIIDDIQEQKRTVSLLRGINNKIENNNKINAELESLAKTIYDYWFLQFDFPNEEGKPYKSSGGRMVWNDELKREIPEKWTVGDLGDICQLINGRAYKQEELLTTGKYKVLRVGNFFTNDSWYYSDLELDDNKYCEEGDLLFCWSASFGPYIWSEGKTIYHYHIWKVEVEKENREFLYYFFKNITQHLMNDKHGSIMAHLTKENMESMKMIIPERTIVLKFHNIASCIINRKISIEKENMELNKIRDFLLPMLMNGQVGFM